MSGFLNLVRNGANVSSIAIATIIVTTTMNSMGFEPSLEAVRGGTEGVGNAFTVGLRYAFWAMTGMILCAMTISAVKGGRVGEGEQPEGAGELEESQAEA